MTSRRDHRPLPDLADVVQRAFDERRDPRDDAACIERLHDDPAALRAFAVLQSRLDVLEGEAAAAAAFLPPQRRRLAPRLAAAGLLAAAAAAFALLLPPRRDAAHTAPVAAALAMPSPILEYHPPLARAAAEVRTREALIDDDTTRLVVVETRTYPR